MKFRNLGNSGLKVSVVGLGTNNFGGRIDKEASIRVVRAAIDAGITLLMAENLRTGFVWDLFMRTPEAQRGMQRAGFKKY